MISNLYKCVLPPANYEKLGRTDLNNFPETTKGILKRKNGSNS